MSVTATIPTSRGRLRPDTVGFVYFITMEPDEYVKIGWALHYPQRRLNELQTGCPHPLRLMAFAPGSLDDERQLHRLFDELRYRGEWFFNYGPLHELIKRLSDNFPKPTNEGAERQQLLEAIWELVGHQALPAWPRPVPA